MALVNLDGCQIKWIRIKPTEQQSFEQRLEQRGLTRKGNRTASSQSSVCNTGRTIIIQILFLFIFCEKPPKDKFLGFSLSYIF